MPRLYDVQDLSEFSQAFFIEDYDELVEFFLKYDEKWYLDRWIYFEKHHIVPRCEGGHDDATNIVCLPYVFHMKAHYLRAKYWHERGNDGLVNKNLFGIRCNFSHAFSRIEFCEAFFSSPVFLRMVSKDKEDLMAAYEQPKVKKKYMWKGYTTKLIREDCVQDWLAKGWKLGKSPTKKPKKD